MTHKPDESGDSELDWSKYEAFSRSAPAVMSAQAQAAGVKRQASMNERMEIEPRSMPSLKKLSSSALSATASG